MTTRTIPKSMPVLRERDYFTYRALKATLIRNLAQAQNYLWAKAYRLYATTAYEGNGRRHAVGETAVDAAPDGNTAVCVSSFYVPVNWGASNRVKVQGRGLMNFGTGTFNAKIWVGVYELDGTYTGTFASPADVTVAGTADWSVTVTVPRDRDVQIRVFIQFNQTSGSSILSSNRYELLAVWARYELGNAAEMGGDAPTLIWKALAHSAAADDMPLSSGLLVDLVRNINSLYASRPPELCQSWLGDNNVNGAAFVEVGRYKVWIPPKVTSVAGYLQCFCTHGGAGNEVRILLNGVVKQTFTAMAAGDSEQVVTSFAVPENAEAVITVEAKSTAAGADWGTIVHGVWLYEDGVTLGLPGGTTVPANYQPIDENELLSDKSVVTDLDGTIRAGVKKLLQNDTWLARHRLRWLIGDWRHRVLKRVDSSPTGFGATPYSYFDWTPGPTGALDTHPKNITIRGDGTTPDAGGGVGDNTNDGIGGFSRGYSNGGTASINSWPATTSAYYRHGRRVGRWRTDPGTGASPLNGVSGARIRMMVRGRRLGPPFYQGKTFSGTPDQGPSIEEGPFIGQGRFALIFSGLESLQVFVPGPNDTTPAWRGPSSQLHSNVGQNFNCVGRLLPQVGTNITDKLEGLLFEIELMSCLLIDEPLSSSLIDALA